MLRFPYSKDGQKHLASMCAKISIHNVTHKEVLQWYAEHMIETETASPAKSSNNQQKKAEYLLQDAADDGCDEAQLQLAYREKARGNNAAYWEKLRKAASEGNEKAKADMDNMYVDTAWSENL